jgi:AraC-like DNA-binding protein
MRTLLQKIHVEEHYSFACRTYTTPQFETNWHKHEEYELILITEGHGTALIGDFVGDYTAGDIFLLGSGLPHWFRKNRKNSIGSAVVLHFRKDCWGAPFLQTPEMKSIKKLLESDNNGISLQKKLQKNISLLLPQVEKTTGISRICLLLNCLQQIADSKQYNILTKGFNTGARKSENTVIEKIFTWTFNHFLENITLTEAAAVAGMSIPSFCRFFKRNIKKSYFDFLKELRIGHACKLLRETNNPILDICYASGYNSWANFSKQFKQLKQMAPGTYRRYFKTIE